jgi:predicted ferric reductase
MLAIMTLPKGTLATTLFLALPLALWCFHQTPSLTAYALGQLLGVFGFTAFTYALLMSIRVPAQEFLFGDLGNSYRFHQTIGTASLIALLLHPIFLAWSYAAFSLNAAAQFLLPIGEAAKILGILALVVLTVCLILTYYVKLPYHIWKKTHRYLSLAFVLGAMHSLLIQGDIQQMPILKLVFVLFFALGTGAIVYRIFFNKLFVRRAEYVVANVTVVNDTFVDVILKPTAKPITVKPGQFAYVTYRGSSVKEEEHPFSIAGSNPDGTLRFVTKKLGDFTNTLPNLKVGDKASIEGPYGSFTFSRGGKTQCWIAGGIGITPFLAFAEALPMDYQATLFYAVRDASENAVPEDIARLQARKPNLTIVVWDSSTQGFLTAEKALENMPRRDVDVFLCGPQGMVGAFREQLLALNIPYHHIHQEKFSMLP